DEDFMNGYHIELPDDGNEVHNLRFRLDDSVVVTVDGRQQDYEVIGSFISFDVEGLSHDIMIYEKNADYLPYYAVCALGLAGIVVYVIIRHHHKKRSIHA
ncbi:MAG: hypothetical protein ACI4WM_07565, partial [Erysipelotrichaceae bacterium]